MEEANNLISKEVDLGNNGDSKDDCVTLDVMHRNKLSKFPTNVVTNDRFFYIVILAETEVNFKHISFYEYLLNVQCTAVTDTNTPAEALTWDSMTHLGKHTLQTV